MAMMSTGASQHAIIASRELKLDGEKSVTLAIREPYACGEDYACECQIVGLGDSKVTTLMGVDSLQALLIAVDALQKQLRPYLNRLSWIGSDEGDDGLPHVIVFRNPLNERLCQVLDVALLRHEVESQKVADQLANGFPRDVIEEANSIKAEVDSSKKE
jgi:hypothetical protein